MGRQRDQRMCLPLTVADHRTLLLALALAQQWEEALADAAPESDDTGRRAALANAARFDRLHRKLHQLHQTSTSTQENRR